MGDTDRVPVDTSGPDPLTPEQRAILEAQHALELRAALLGVPVPRPALQMPALEIVGTPPAAPAQGVPSSPPQMIRAMAMGASRPGARQPIRMPEVHIAGKRGKPEPRTADVQDGNGVVMAHGGEVPEPNHKVLHEHEDHFVVDDGSGQPFRVAKDGLGEKLIGKIRGYSDGGQVDGGYTNVPDAGYQQSFFAPPQETPPIQAPADPAYNPWTNIRPDSPADHLMQALARGSRPGSPAASLMQSAGYDPALEAQPLPPIGLVPDTTSAPGPAQGMPGSITKKDQQKPAPSGPGAVQAGQGADPYTTAANQMQMANRGQADLAAVQSGEQTAIWQNYLAETQAREAQMQAKLAERQAIADQKHAAILESKIDPSRLWHNSGIGGQVATAIGMILGGLGAGSTGGRNLAVDQLNKSIDRDIEAQKVDLGAKQTDLEMYLREGRDMLSAAQLVKADKLDQVSAQMKLSAAKYGGQEAALQAEMNGAKLRMDAEQLRRNALTQDMQLRIAGAGLKAQQDAAKAAQAQAEHLAKVIGAPRTPSGGIALAPGATEVLPEKMRERRVMLPDGSTGFAKDAKEAGDLSSALQSVAESKRQLQRYRDLLGNGHTVISPSDRAQARSLRSSIMLALKDAAKLGAISGSDMDLMESQIPDITSATTLDSTLSAGLDAFGKSLDDKVLTRLRALGGAQ